MRLHGPHVSRDLARGRVLVGKEKGVGGLDNCRLVQHLASVREEDVKRGGLDG